LEPRGNSVSTRLALFILAAVPVVLFWPCLVGGKMLWGPDIQTLQFMFATAARRALAQHELPHWLPEILGGMPSIAGTNLLFFHPTEFLAAVLGVPPWAVFGLDSAIQVALGALGFFYLARRLSLGREASLLGALAFALSGTQISLLYPGHINNSKAVAMIPWVFWGALKGWQEGTLLGWAWAGVALALQVLGLGLQVFAYTIIALSAFALWLPYSNFASAHAEAPGHARLKPAFIGLVLCGLFAFLLSAPQLLPSLEYKAYSWREGFTYEQFTSWSFAPKESLTWIVPGFYGWHEPSYHGDWPFCLTTEYFGLLPWMLAFAALAAAWRSESWRARLARPEAYFLGLAVFSYLAGIGKHFPLHHLFFHLPVYNGFRTWTRFLNLLTFAVCLLGAYGWDALLKLEGAELLRALKGARTFGALALVVAVGCLSQAPQSILASAGTLTQKMGQSGAAEALQLAQSSAFKAVLLSLGLLGASFVWLRFRAQAKLLFYGAVIVLAFDASEVPRRYLQFQAPQQVLARPTVLNLLPDPQGLEPYRLWDPANAWIQNTAGLFGYEALTGYHGVQMAAPMKLQESLAKVNQVGWLNLTNTRYIISKQPLGVPAGWTELTQGQGDTRVYQNPNAWPRAFVLGTAVDVPDDDAAFKLLGTPGFDITKAPVLHAPSLPGGPLQGGVRFTHRTVNTSSLEAAASRPALLVVSQTWYPAWRATVDGVATPVLQAYGGALSALALPAGTHKIELWYQPTTVYSGLALALLGVLALVWLARRKELR
jgi:hypothetical protein